MTDGQRNISITAQDAVGLNSSTIYVYINVMERNDGPAVDLGAGFDADRTIVYVEGGPSISLGLTNLIDIMDEEGQRIQSLSAALNSTNGMLDEEDTIFPQSPLFNPFIEDPNTIAGAKYFHVEGNFTTEQFIGALSSLRFINMKDEPTIFVNSSDTKLTREVIITVTDRNQSSNKVRVRIDIQPINDNAPRIRLVTDPASCSEDWSDVTLVRYRRDARISRRKRHSQISQTGAGNKMVRK